MVIDKQQVLELVRKLPEKIDIDELIYSLYLRQKLESAEKDIKKGCLISHEKVEREISHWFNLKK